MFLEDSSASSNVSPVRPLARPRHHAFRVRRPAAVHMSARVVCKVNNGSDILRQAMSDILGALPGYSFKGQHVPEILTLVFHLIYSFLQLSYAMCADAFLRLSTTIPAPPYHSIFLLLLPFLLHHSSVTQHAHTVPPSTYRSRPSHAFFFSAFHALSTLLLCANIYVNST